MKKIIVAVAMAAFAQVASAAIAGSAHDFSAAPQGLGGTLSSCQYCHAPHNVNPASAQLPLWNRAVPAAGGYTTYNRAGGTVAGAPGEASLTCLGCHDGSQAIGQTFTGSADPTMGTIGVIAGGTVPAVFNVGTNLTNDHPVGVVYTPAAGSFNPIANLTAAGLKLYVANAVECASCHDPHGTAAVGGGSDKIAGGQSFLRADLGTICSTCHIK